jgi:lactate racemase
MGNGIVARTENRERRTENLEPKTRNQERIMLAGQGSTTAPLREDDVRRVLADAIETLRLDGRRVLVIVPDGTRTAPIPLLFRLLYEQLGRRVARLDYLIALGTHQPMTDAAIDRLVGVDAATRTARYPDVSVINHRWDDPAALTTIGTIAAHEVAELTDGLLAMEIPVRLNRLILDYDQVIICGPVFPHEVAGFSGGAKYLFPGIAGAEIINATHWLGALSTSMATIGVKDTLVRRVIHRAAAFVERPLLCVALVLRADGLHGICRRSSTSSGSIVRCGGCCRCPQRATTTCGRRPRLCTKPSRSLLMVAR